MSDEADRPENAPYFRWRRDGSIQTTLGLAAGGIFLAFASIDVVAASLHHTNARLLHLAFLVLAGIFGGSMIFQFRPAVLAAVPICCCAIAADIAGMVVRPSAFAIGIAALSILLNGLAILRTRTPLWAAFRQYCRTPEIIPKADSVR